MPSFRTASLTFAASLKLSVAFLYIPFDGEIWDPSITYWNGSFYLHAMYQLPQDRTNRYAAGWLATSSDGVRWADGGAIAPEHPGNDWWKGFVRQIRADPDPLFVMDHGVYEPGKGNDALRFLTSTDLRHWTEIYRSNPDPRWYHTGGRWDHMYMSEDAEVGGYIGFAVASPTVPGFPGTWPGVLRSADGIHYEVHPPLNVSWNGVGLTSIEEGGFERMEANGRYYLIGGGGGHGHGYSVWVFHSEHIAGPYEPLVDGFMLSSGGYAHLASWCRGLDGELLFSDYFPIRARAEVWLLPLRKAALDSGRLRMAYWPGNDALRGRQKAVNATMTATCAGSAGVAWLASFNLSEHMSGGVLRGKLVGGGMAGQGSVGLALEDFYGDRSYMEHTDLPGSDYNYSGVDYADPHQCQVSCDADTTCQAWTYVGAGASSPESDGYPLPRCCLKNALPAAKGNIACTSGIKNSTSSAAGHTAVLMDLGEDGAADASMRVLHYNSAGLDAEKYRAAHFECGDGKNNKSCGVATVTAVRPDEEQEFLVLFRQGMFEVYVGGYYVHTFTYGGQYPLPADAAAARLGIACDGASSVEVRDVQAWEMSLGELEVLKIV